MKTKVLGPNQRIKIGEDTPPFGSEWMQMARVLRSVGLTLEFEHIRGNICSFYVARRPSTHDITVANKPSPVAPLTP